MLSDFGVSSITVGGGGGGVEICGGGFGSFVV